MKSFLQHFLLLNVIVLAIGWMLTNNFPGRVYITAETESGLVIQTDCGRGCRFDGTETKHFWLPDGYFKGDLILRRCAGKESAKITSVRVWSRLVFEHRWIRETSGTTSNLAKLDFDKDGMLTLRASESSWGLSRVGWIALVGGEIGLAILAVVFLLFARAARWSAPTIGGRIVSSVVVAVAVAVFCGGIVPLQTLLSNQAELGLPVGPVLLALFWRITLLALVLSTLLVWSTRFAGALYLILASAVLVYEYLETGVLTIGCPSLNGDMTYYKDLTRMAWDALVFPVVFILLFVLYRSFPRSAILIPCAVYILGISSLLDVHAAKPDYQSDLKVELKPKRQVVRETVYSKNKNVLVYVLDSAATPYLQMLFGENPSFAERLTGFTCYMNHLGMFNGTVLSVAGMTTGKYFDDVSKEVAYMYSVYSRDSLLAEYVDGQSAVFFNPGSFEDGVSIPASADASNQYQSSNRHPQLSQLSPPIPLQKRMEGQQPWNLAELTRFRLLPFGAKYLVNVFTVGGWDISASADNESWTYPRLADAPIVDTPMSLHWFHTNGAHPPYGVSRTGVDDGRVQDGDEAKLNKLWHVWSQLILLFEKLIARGLYDCSTIVVTADHGLELDADNSHPEAESHLSARAWPILLVKPPFATDPFRSSDVPTSHSRIHNLICRARTEQLTNLQVDDILRCNERYYSRPCPEKGGFDNFYVDAKRHVSARFEPSKGDDPLARPIEMNHRYSLLGNNLMDRPPIRTKNISFFSAEGGFQTTGGSLQFRLPESQKGMNLVAEFDINAPLGSEIIDGCSGRRIAISKPYKHIERISISPANDGVVTLSFKRKGDEHVSIYSLMVK